MAGLAAGWLVDGRPVGRALSDPAVWKPGLLFLTAGMAPDIDLLVGAHSGPTHGIGAAVIAACAALALTRRLRWAIAVGAAYASHILLDWLGTDTRAPIGIMALWPFSRQYYESSLHVFLGVSRQIHASNFWSYNLRAFARELIVLVPLLLAMGILRKKVLKGAELNCP
jgi:inner membrane protein